ncbi:uncharacterized protein LOC133746399 isoform X1 [Rosa rugosa]|uniref:uncharacterized protein LOC133746399 isoform X1 n=1 Tax=Rosa rugosa TaxID=74645 RepID=UPI002B40C572|nr:uncharacterized protein LOC133746399 isoform X1 [Rosa rugosa]
MGSKRKRSKKLPNRAVEETPTPNRLPPLTFQTLISAIEAPQGLKVPVLKRIYALVVPLSLQEPIDWSNAEGSCNYFGIELKLEDLQCLIHCLFKELDKRLKFLFSALSDASANRAHKHTDSDKDMAVDVDEITLLLRCCVSLSMVDPSLVMENTQFLLLVLGKLIALVTSGCSEKESVSFRKSVSCECTYTDAGGTYVSKDFVASLCFLEPSNLWHPVLCALLEIFADELLMRRLLRKYFVAVDSASCTNERLFNNLVKSDIGSVLEVISVHFILSAYDEPASENFLKRLYLQFSKNFRGPELSLTAALPLLLNPIMLSAPKMLQTHFILLVSEAIDIDTSLKNVRPDLRNMDCYLTAFERSVVLYTSHMSSSLMDHHALGVSCSHANSWMLGSHHPSFESCIQQGTREKICNRVTHLGSLRQLTKSGMMAASTAYINENQHIFNESCKDDILSVLHSIIHGASSSDANHNVFYRKGNTNPEDIYLLASILKLMSSSLLKVIWCLRNGGNSGYPQTLKDASSLKEYDFVVGIIGCFIQFNLSLSNQKFLSDMMKTRPMIHKTSKWILLHFLGLLSLSFASGIDFLVKGCISIIMAILNLCAFEEGDIVALRSFLDAGSQSVSSELPADKVTQAVKKQKSIRKVASKFQKTQNVYLSKHSVTRHHKKAQSDVAKTSENACFMSCTREFSDIMEEGTEETCTGEMYLNCTLAGSKKSDLDDLADFIVCKPGKEYSSWLKDREKYRSWKVKKEAVVRWEKKKRTYRKVNSKRS